MRLAWRCSRQHLCMHARLGAEQLSSARRMASLLAIKHSAATICCM